MDRVDSRKDYHTGLVGIGTFFGPGVALVVCLDFHKDRVAISQRHSERTVLANWHLNPVCLSGHGRNTVLVSFSSG